MGATISFATGDEELPERIVLQRMRTRAIEAVQLLAEGDAGVRSVGTNEWANQFCDVVDDDSPWDWRSWTVWTHEEVVCVGKVHDCLLDVCRQTSVSPQWVVSGMLKSRPDAGDGPVPAVDRSPTGHLVCSASATKMPAGPRR